MWRGPGPVPHPDRKMIKRSTPMTLSLPAVLMVLFCYSKSSIHSGFVCASDLSGFRCLYAACVVCGAKSFIHASSCAPASADLVDIDFRFSAAVDVSLGGGAPGSR